MKELRRRTKEAMAFGVGVLEWGRVPDGTETHRGGAPHCASSHGLDLKAMCVHCLFTKLMSAFFKKNLGKTHTYANNTHNTHDYLIF